MLKDQLSQRTLQKTDFSAASLHVIGSIKPGLAKKL
jgi:hypothetical protein